VAFAAAGLDGIGQSRAEAAVISPDQPQGRGNEAVGSDQTRPKNAHFQAHGGINNAYLVDQLAGNGQSIANLAFITSISGGNLELLGQGGAGTYVKLNYLDGSGTERTGLAVTTGNPGNLGNLGFLGSGPTQNGDAMLHVDSEVGRLRQVILHRPDLELKRLTPDNAADLLFDDVLWVSRAQAEHDAFAAVLRSRCRRSLLQRSAHPDPGGSGRARLHPGRGV